MGYIGTSRSVRSRNAIYDFEVPMALLNDSLKNEFLTENSYLYTENEMKILKNTAVTKWKYVCREIIEPSSWHHTGSFYRKTYHYDLRDIADTILNHNDNLNSMYKEYMEKLKLKKLSRNFSYGIIEVQDWGGTRNHPKILGVETNIGIISNNWFYYKCGSKIFKYKISSNKVKNLKEYKSYSDLVKANKEYKGKVKIFNSIIKEIIK